MSAPLFALLYPTVVALVLLLLRGWPRLVALLGTLLAAFFAWSLWILPIGRLILIGRLSFRLGDVLTVFGRRFLVLDSDRQLLALIYAFAALWFVMLIIRPMDGLFIPLGFGVVALLTAAMAVDPFLYAALFLQIAILISVPILVPPGESPGMGVLRFLTFQTLGMPFILFTGWMLGGVEASPGELTLVVRAAILLGFGFAFLLAIIPFHSWIPMLLEKSSPYAAGFLLFMLPTGIMLFGLGFLDRYTWLRNSQELPALLRFVGILMVLAGGLLAAFQRNLGRILGYAIIHETGLVCLTLSLPRAQILSLFFGLLLVRGLAIVLWSLCLEVIGSGYPNLDYRTVQGYGRQDILTAAGLVAAHFSLAGFPLLAGFPMHLSLLQALVATGPLIALLSLAGQLGLLMSGLRSLAVFVMVPEPVMSGGKGDLGEITNSPGITRATIHDTEGYRGLALRIAISAQVVLLGLIGIFPQWVGPLLISLAGAFTNLAR